MADNNRGFAQQSNSKSSNPQDDLDHEQLIEQQVDAEREEVFNGVKQDTLSNNLKLKKDTIKLESEINALKQQLVEKEQENKILDIKNQSYEKNARKDEEIQNILKDANSEAKDKNRILEERNSELEVKIADYKKVYGELLNRYNSLEFEKQDLQQKYDAQSVLLKEKEDQMLQSTSKLKSNNQELIWRMEQYKLGMNQKHAQVLDELAEENENLRKKCRFLEEKKRQLEIQVEQQSNKKHARQRLNDGTGKKSR